MLTWILIALAICLIFGVIQIDQLKKYADTIMILAKNLFSKAKNEIDKQIAASKTENHTQNTTKTETKKETTEE